MHEIEDEATPDDLLTLLTAQHVGMQRVELRRRGKRIKRWGLTTADGSDVSEAEQMPSDTPEEIHALVVDTAEQHAVKHGAGRYHVAIDSVGRSQRAYVLVVSDSGTDSPRSRAEDSRFEHESKLYKILLELSGKFPEILDRMVQMTTKIAEAHVTVMSAREAATTNQLQLEMLRHQYATEERRERFAADAIKPFLTALRSKWGASSSSPAPAESGVEPVVAHARALYRSCDASQLAKLREALGAENVDALRDGDAARVAFAVAAIIATPDDRLSSAIDVLRDDQHPLLASLNTAAQAYKAPTTAALVAAAS